MNLEFGDNHGMCIIFISLYSLLSLLDIVRMSLLG